MGLSYKDAGVDIDAGDELVERIKPLVKATHRPEVLGAIGGFAGMCALPTGYRNPIMVSGTDGVGTKLKTALETGRHNTIGIDLVAMCVNDVPVTGAAPLFFLDYYASAALDIEVATAVIAGIADGCKQSNCSLVGGETAEMPGLYKEGDYDLAGFCVGIVERDEIHSGKDLKSGDLLIGISSSGLHSNGHSLARMALLEKLSLAYADTPDTLAGQSIADVLLEPTTLYVRAFAALAEAKLPWKAAAHITGGGLIENPPRMLESPDLDFCLNVGSWAEPAVFALIASAGVEPAEMRRTFNMGLGMLLAVSPGDASNIVECLEKSGYAASTVGELKAGSGQVVFA
ncbi:MAG: phosphoribosylformylglycinamidine cyclo-ligase [Kofleriaceae bacterium]|nr:phosphoribosylformylglycinamidine cyclo-ligase [Kofleriaceae bacterium]